jgi:hypothetical protein
VRKHPKDLLLFLWDAVPSEARDASLTLGRTKEGLLGRTKRRGNEVRDAWLALGRTKEGLLGRTEGVKSDFDSKGRFSLTAENVFQQHRIGETGYIRLLLCFYFSNPKP